MVLPSVDVKEKSFNIVDWNLLMRRILRILYFSASTHWYDWEICLLTSLSLDEDERDEHVLRVMEYLEQLEGMDLIKKDYHGFYELTPLGAEYVEKRL